MRKTASGLSAIRGTPLHWDSVRALSHAFADRFRRTATVLVHIFAPFAFQKLRLGLVRVQTVPYNHMVPHAHLDAVDPTSVTMTCPHGAARTTDRHRDFL